MVEPRQAAPPVASRRAGRTGTSRGRRLGLAAAVGAATLAGVFLWQRPSLAPWSSTSPSGDGWASLIAAAGRTRAVEARLSANFAYGPLEPVPRGVAGSSTQNLPLLAAAGVLQKAATADGSPTHLHRWGVAQLLLGDVPGAVTTLEQAVEEPDTNAARLADLSAAYAERARLTGRISDWPLALATAERALRLSPGLASASFNKALALAALSLRQQAAREWDALARREPDAGWRAEIVQRRQRVATSADRRERFERLLREAVADEPGQSLRLASEFPRATRELVEDTLWPRWGELAAAGNPGAARWLTRASAMLDTLPGKALLRGAPADASSRQDARAYAAFGRGRAEFKAGRYNDSMSWFAEARRLARPNSWLAIAAALHEATNLYYAGQTEPSAQALLAVVQRADAARHAAIAGRAQWMLGIIRGAQSRIDESIHHYALSRAAYLSLQEADFVATADQLTADAYAALGDYDEAWLRLTGALQHWHADWNPARHLNALMVGQLTARRGGLPEVVLAFHDAVSDFIAAQPDPIAGAESNAAAALGFEATGQHGEAQAAIARARTFVGEIVDGGMRTQVAQRVGRAEATLAVDDPAGVVERLSAVAQEYERSGASIALAEVYLGLGRAHELLGQRPQALAAFEKGVAAVEEQRRTAPTKALRISYFDRVWGVYDETLAAYVARRDTDTALAFADRHRARVLSEASATATPASLDAVRARLTADDAVVFFAVLPRAVGTWVIRHGQTTYVSLDRSVLNLPRQIERSLRTPAAARATLSEAYTRVWQPLEAALAGASRVVVVPDQALALVPFAALVNPRSQRALVQDVTVSMVPSLRSLGGRATPAPGALTRRPLVVASSAPSGSAPPLTHTADEAARIAELYGGRADVDTLAPMPFLARAADATLIHFAGHAVPNADRPDLSRLVLNAGASGDLYAYAIEAQRLHAAPVVVLSACSAAAGTVRDGEGSLSLARPFLAAGARAVIASLWDVDDSRVGDVVVRLHQALLSGLEPAAALAAAQRELIAAGESADLASWAGFVVFES